jgi:hypothetical protein
MNYIGLYSFTAKTEKMPDLGQVIVEIRVRGFNKDIFHGFSGGRGLGRSALFLSNSYCAPARGYFP